MKITPFKLEEYLTEYEFSSPYLLCCSDVETLKMTELLALADKTETKLWEELTFKYTEPYGLPLLREAIASRIYEKVSAENILCFAGAEEGIYCALYTLCNPGDHVIVLTPCYQSLKEIPALKVSEMTLIALKEENQWKIDLNEIEAAIRPNTTCLVMNFPHNPTGQIISSQELADLVTILESKGIWLFADEVYRLLGNPSTPWASAATDVYDRALSLGVMSKSFGMPGLRVGWIACQDKTMLQRIKGMKDYGSICNSAPSEILSLIAIKNQEQLLARNNQIVMNNLDLLNHFFKRYSTQFRWVKPQGGCIGVVEYLSDESVDIFCKRIVESHGILLMPGSVYDCESNHFRIGYGRLNMPKVLKLFEDAIQS